MTLHVARGRVRVHLDERRALGRVVRVVEPINAGYSLEVKAPNPDAPRHHHAVITTGT